MENTNETQHYYPKSEIEKRYSIIEKLEKELQESNEKARKLADFNEMIIKQKAQYIKDTQKDRDAVNFLRKQKNDLQCKCDILVNTLISYAKEENNEDFELLIDKILNEAVKE